MGGGTRRNWHPLGHVPKCRMGLSPRGRGNQPVTPLTDTGKGGVYPRVGGGTYEEIGNPRLFSGTGLSPRGRGNQPVSPSPIDRGKGSIPAWAGEPRISNGWAGLSAWAGEPRIRFPLTVTLVYPRVGGGTRHLEVIGGALCGLSPRGRGNRNLSRYVRGGVGSIPAWAGEPRSVAKMRHISWVYPRVGGGTPLTSPLQGNLGRVYPRVGGGTYA